jgi:penicillin-binding protein 2
MKGKKTSIKLGKDTENRMKIYMLAVVVVYSILMLRLFYLQVFKGAYYKNLSERNRVKMKKIDAPRGKIFDRNGNLLVTNVAGYRLVYLNERSYDDKILEEISKLVNLDTDTVERLIRNSEVLSYTRENILLDDLPEEEAHRIMERLSDYPYLDVQAYSKRKYNFGEMASHVLGYVKRITAEEYQQLKDKGYTKRDIVGKKGIEKQYDKLLQGKDGYEYIEVNALNKLVRKIRHQEASQGKDLYLTLDIRLQEYMTNYLEEHKLKAAFVALNPKTGEVITKASTPEYSLNMFSSKFSQSEWNEILHDEGKPLQNRFLMGTYPPGSVFKVISALTFLKEGINPDIKHYDPGYYQLGKWKWRTWKRGGHGYVDMEKSLVESVNTYYYELGDKIGYKPIVNIAEKMGLGKLTGIDLPDEKSGVLPDSEWKKKNMKEAWYRGDTINLSIGQGYVLVTPLQIAMVYSIMANKGYAYTPHLLKKIGDEAEYEKTIRYKVDLPEEDFDRVNSALEKVVTEKDGTAKVLKTEGLRIAAKTGSAQNNQYKITHAWTAGFFPAEDPEVVFVTFVEGGGGGGGVAAPIAKLFIDKYMELYN